MKMIDSLVCLEGRCTWSVLVMVSWVRLTPALSELPYRDLDIFRSCSLFPVTKLTLALDESRPTLMLRTILRAELKLL